MDIGVALKEGDTPERMALQQEIAETVQKAMDELPDDLKPLAQRNGVVIRRANSVSNGMNGFRHLTTYG